MKIAITDSARNYLPLGNYLQNTDGVADILLIADFVSQSAEISEFKPDVFIAEATFNGKVEPGYSEDLYQKYISNLDNLKKAGTKTFLWSVDEPLTSKAVAKWSCHFDYLLIHALNNSGMHKVKSIFYFPCFFDPKDYFTIKQPYQYDISFIGSLYGKRCVFLDKVLSKLVKLGRVAVVGSRGLNYFAPRGLDKATTFIQDTPLETSIINNVMNQSKITLCFGCYGDSDNSEIYQDLDWEFDNSDRQVSYGIIQRAFEVLPTQSLLVTDYRVHMAEHTSDQFRFVSYKSIPQCLDLIDHYLSNPIDRQSIVSFSNARAPQESVVARAQWLFDTIKRLSND